MAKSKAKARQPVKANEPVTPDSSHRTLLVALVVIAVLAISAIIVTMSNDDDNLTAWATVKSRELHLFMQDCKATGGTVDVRPNEAPQIIFVCQYEDRSVEYMLQPGK